VSKDIEF